MAALGSAAEAEDAAQDAWIAAHARLGNFRGASSFRTWLLTIVWNKAMDRRRQTGRWIRRVVTLDAGWDTGTGNWTSGRESSGGTSAERGIEEPTGRVALALSEWRPSPEQAVLDDELGRRIQGLVRALPAKLRDPLMLIGTGEHTYEDVAAMLAVPTGTVKWRVSEARRQLRAKLERRGF